MAFGGSAVSCTFGEGLSQNQRKVFETQASGDLNEELVMTVAQAGVPWPSLTC